MLYIAHLAHLLKGAHPDAGITLGVNARPSCRMTPKCFARRFSVCSALMAHAVHGARRRRGRGRHPSLLLSSTPAGTAVMPDISSDVSPSHRFSYDKRLRTLQSFARAQWAPRMLCDVDSSHCERERAPVPLAFLRLRFTVLAIIFSSFTSHSLALSTSHAQNTVASALAHLSRCVEYS
eukprot:6184443-Pleurochrysis_carterae.AAC.1